MHGLPKQPGSSLRGLPASPWLLPLPELLPPPELLPLPVVLPPPELPPPPEPGLPLELLLPAPPPLPDPLLPELLLPEPLPPSTSPLPDPLLLPWELIPLPEPLVPPSAGESAVVLAPQCVASETDTRQATSRTDDFTLQSRRYRTGIALAKINLCTNLCAQDSPAMPKRPSVHVRPAGRRAAAALRYCAVSAAMGASAMLVRETALANGRLPAGHQLIVSPDDPSFFVMETSFGVLVSHDTGASWNWICERAVGYGLDGGIEDPAIGLTSSAILAGLRAGLSSSTDLGCTWAFARSDPIVDVVVRPDDPHAALALASSYLGVGNAGENLYDTYVLASSDDGAHWARLGVAIDPAIVVETIDLARGDPRTIYLSGARRQSVTDGGIDRVGVVLASSDLGASYRESTIALDPRLEVGGAAFIAGVDPIQPDRVYVRMRGGAADRLIVSDDGAATFRTVYQGKSFLAGFALSSNGATVYLGGPVDGVLAATTSNYAGAALQFAKQSDAAIQCLTLAGDTLYACMSSFQGFYIQQLGVSTDHGVTFLPKFPFACLNSPLSCPGCTVANECGPDLPLLRATLGACDRDGGNVPTDVGCSNEDAGADEAGTSNRKADGGSAQPSRLPSRGGCVCGLGYQARSGGIAATIAAIVTMRMRKRSRAPRSNRKPGSA